MFSKHLYTKKWSYLSYPAIWVELSQRLRESVGEIRHAIGQYVLDAVTQVIFAVIVQAIRNAIRLHVMDVGISVIFPLSSQET